MSILIEKLKSNYLIFFIILCGSITSVHFYIFINSGGSIINFINTNFTILYRIFFIRIEELLYTKYNK